MLQRFGLIEGLFLWVLGLFYLNCFRLVLVVYRSLLNRGIILQSLLFFLLHGVFRFLCPYGLLRLLPDPIHSGILRQDLIEGNAKTLRILISLLDLLINQRSVVPKRKPTIIVNGDLDLLIA